VIGRHGWPAVPAVVQSLNCQLVALRRGVLSPMMAGVRSMRVSGGPDISYSDGAIGQLPPDFLRQLRPYVRDASVV
jgi:hypothetical protein